REHAKPSQGAGDKPARGPRPSQAGTRPAEVGMESFRIEVGHAHGVKPSNIVGAIANEADLESRYIGRIDIRDDHSLVELPEGMPRDVLADLEMMRLAGQHLHMRRADVSHTGAPPPSGNPGFT